MTRHATTKNTRRPRPTTTGPPRHARLTNGSTYQLTLRFDRGNNSSPTRAPICLEEGMDEKHAFGRDGYARVGTVPLDSARTDGTASRANAATAMIVPLASRVSEMPITALTGPTMNGPRGLRAYDPTAS